MNDKTPDLLPPVEKSFLAQLVEDVFAAEAHCRAQNNQSNNRNLIRTVFAALEGAVWICREHVRESARTLGELTPLIDLALRERSYMVTDRGDVVEQVRSITLPAMIRLIVKQTKQFAPDLVVDFGGSGWEALRAAIIIRNRATHPKSTEDLTIMEADIQVFRDAFFWILALTQDVMGASNSAQRTHNKDMRELLAALKRGDPTALRDYQYALAQANAED